MKRFTVDAPLLATSSPSCDRHPLGSRARVLLTSVFGPYAQDDEYGSRVINPMELYHNQVTRVQGPFSLRMFHRSWGLMFIQGNLQAPCTLLDFPTLERFVEELRTQQYDVVGITGIVPNVAKVKKMCELVRKYLPQAKIVVGGHVASIPDLERRIDADYIVRGEGVRWFRNYLGEDSERPLRHPQVFAGIGMRTVGIAVREKPIDIAAVVIPSVGCPIGCNFCSTSAMFGGKGRSVTFYRTGDELFDIMSQLEANMKVQSFFMMDENFLLDRKRALRLLELMRRHNKPWALFVFSSANVLRSYTIEQLVGLGISWLWLGLEGKDSQYTKLRGMDAPGLVRQLQAHGVRVLGSTIIGLENHTPENIDEVIDYAVDYNTDFHQFMLYTPLPGTPLHAEMTALGRMKDESECEPADVHGQYRFGHHHPHIRDGLEEELLLRAFQRDFDVNGPTVVRIVRTTLSGWLRHKSDPDHRVRRRFAWEARQLATNYSAMAGAARHYYRRNPAMRAKMDALLGDLHREFGLTSRIFSALAGPYVRWKIHREEKRLARGWTFEPPTYYEHNEAAQRVASSSAPEATLSRPVSCSPMPPISVESLQPVLPELVPVD